MGRLIDADELAKIINEFDMKYFQKMLLRQGVAQLPDVDVAEVVHGRWEEKYDAFHDMYWTLCSSCHYTGARHFHYCPNCGAKMDLEKTLI